MDSIVACGVFRDAASHIVEWLAFHRLVGVDRFVLYDLGSADDTAGRIRRSRFAHQATVVNWQGKGRAEAYGDFAAHHAAAFTWAAIVDPGDFLHPLEADSIRVLLPRYDGFSAVLLRRLHFAPPARAAHPVPLATAGIHTRVPDESPLNGTALALLRVRDLRGVHGTPPAFDLAGAACDARGEHAPTPPGQAPDAAMIVNHYAVAADPHATLPDRRIARFIPRLRTMLHDVTLAAAPRPAPAPAASPQPAPSGAALTLGIGVITYNREQVLRETLDRVQQHTRHPRTILAVADDGSTDGTLTMLRARGVLTVTGRNSGIAWNKNRALFLLSELLRCDVVILLEDDAYPSRDNWESEWIHAAVRWGHANVAAHWLREHFISGAGTVEDPVHSERITAQCAVFSREALLFGGFFDTRFRGYGHEHVEHTRRLLRLGYGGLETPTNGHPGPLFKLLTGGVSYHAVPSTVPVQEEQSERNRLLAQQLFADFSYRAAWRNEDEARQLRDEMRHSFPRAVL